MKEKLKGERLPKLPKAELEKYQAHLRQLRRALRACLYGEGGEKEYIKAYIFEYLEQKKPDGAYLNRLLPYAVPQRMRTEQKFAVLLFLYEKQFGKEGFERLCTRWGLPKEKKEPDGMYYEIGKEDIDAIYEAEEISLTRKEQLRVIAEEIYEGFGHGVIDKLRDFKLDGISGGISGIPEQFYRYTDELFHTNEGMHAYDSIFVMYKGNTVRLSFLSFGSEKELRRVTKALLRYEAPGELTYYRPYMVNDMKDGSRVFACRPPFSESWAFFVRKFDSAERKSLPELLSGEGAKEIADALAYFVAGGLHIAISGAQGSGKTTLLKAMVAYINPKYNLRIEESVFELWMRKEFPKRNILTFRETESVGATEGLNAFRKTDGNCLMMGEIGSIDVAALMIELSQVSEQQLFTHHAMSTEKLLGYFRNALLRCGTYSDERLAEEQVLSAFRIHVLCEKDLSGRRYIGQIAEICAGEQEKIRVLYRYENGRYKRVNPVREELLLKMEERLPPQERSKMRRFFLKTDEKERGKVF